MVPRDRDEDEGEDRDPSERAAAEHDGDTPIGWTRVRRWVARRYRKLFPGSWTRKALRWAKRNSDLEDQARLRPPPDERVEVHVLWLVEAFGPSQAEALIRDLRRAGLTKTRGRLSRAWELRVAERRRSAFGRSWDSLPLIVGPDWKGFDLDTVRMPLPDGVYAAAGSLQQLAPSLTVVVMGFMLTDEGSLHVQRELARDHWSRAEGTGRTRSVYPPTMTQREAIREARAETRRQCARWLSERLPGAFASGVGDGHFPSAELVTARVVSPLAKRSYNFPNEWPLTLDLDTWRTWECTKEPALRLADANDGVERWGLFLGGDADSLLPSAEEAEREGAGSPRWRLFQRQHRRLAGIIALWGLSCLLEGYHFQLALARDAALHRSRRTGRALRRIRNVQSHLRTAADACAVAADVETTTELPAWRWVRTYDGADFVYREPDPESDVESDERESWIEGSIGYIQRQAVAVNALEARVRDQLSLETNLISAAANLRVQRAVLWFSAFVAILGLAALAIDHWR